MNILGIRRILALIIITGGIVLGTSARGSSPNLAAPEVTVPGIVSTTSDTGGMHTRADTVLPSMRYGSHIDPNRASLTLERLDIRSVGLHAPNQIGVNRSVTVSPKTRPQKFVNPDGSQT